MSSLYTHNLNFSPARAVSPRTRTNPDVHSQYLAELLAERQRLEPLVQVLPIPICSRLLNQEISRISSMLSNHLFGEYDIPQRGSPSPMAYADIMPKVGATSLSGWGGRTHERFGGLQGMAMDWQAAPGSPNAYIVKRVLRLEIPVHSYPNFNFVGRLLGPRGNSLKRVEASTGCKVFIRGNGSIKDPNKEERLRGRPGFEHLNDQLHILIEAELPVNIIETRLRQAQETIQELLKPVEESQDLFKRQQLRELAMLNSNLREESSRPSGSVSPFGSSGMKRAKTGR